MDRTYNASTMHSVTCGYLPYNLAETTDLLNQIPNFDIDKLTPEALTMSFNNTTQSWEIMRTKKSTTIWEGSEDVLIEDVVISQSYCCNCSIF